jgi:hypothetical protein
VNTRPAIRPTAQDFPRERVASCCPCCFGQDLAGSPAILMPFIAHRVFGWAPVEIDASWGLQTIRPGMAYSVCKSLRCVECGLVFLDIRFSDEELGALYRDYRGPAYVALRDQYEPGYAQRNALLNQGVPFVAEIEAFLAPWLSLPVRVLDWGGDTGKNTPFARDRSVCHIYDISNKPVLEGMVRVDKASATATASVTPYDLVVCSQVLEHVPYPSEVMLEMQALMGEQTILYVEVPHETLMQDGAGLSTAHERKRHWHEHVNFFTQEALRRLAQACSLRVLALQVLATHFEGRPIAVLQMACQR